MALTRRTFLEAAGAAALAARAPLAAPAAPNVVLILCDDLGYGDLHVYGSAHRMPNLDRFAAEGVRFTQFDSADPVCSPSRAALLTGRYPTRVGVPRVLFPQDAEGLALDEKTMADCLKSSGYKTAAIGKWHLGRPDPYLPTSRGFDEYLGIPYSNDMKPLVMMEGTRVIEQNPDIDSLTRRYTERAVDFLNRAQGSPFFLYLAHSMPHIPLGASAAFRGKSPLGLYGDVMMEIDWSTGEILKALERRGMRENTLVLFTSDNGPWFQGSPGRLRGRKTTTYEGGVREPFLARLPGRIPAGRVCDGLASMLDLLPTILKLTGARAPARQLDGIDIWPLLTGGKPAIERDVLLYFDNYNLQCARWNRWKLHLTRYDVDGYNSTPQKHSTNYPLNHPELYDLELDPDESYDVAAEHPDVVRHMQARVEELIGGFPAEAQRAWAETKARINTEERTGARPRGRQ